MLACLDISELVLGTNNLQMISGAVTGDTTM